MHTTRYMIIEDGQPMDGELLLKEHVFAGIAYAGYDAEIVSFDLAECVGSGATPMRLCTEDLVTEWWSADGSRETWERVVAGKTVGLASRFFGDEVAKMEARAA